MKKYVSPELLIELVNSTNIMYTGNYGSDVDMDIFGRYTDENEE